MIVLVFLLAYLVTGWYLVNKPLTQRMVHAKYEDMDSYYSIYNEPKERLRKIKTTRKEAAALTIPLGAVFPLYFAWVAWSNYIDEAPPVVDAEARDRIELMQRRIKELEKDTGIGRDT